MMHKCSGSSCSCSYGGLFQSQSNSFSMLFSAPNNNKNNSFVETDMYSFMSPSSSVDCTLSLGTPSTRSSEDDEKRIRHDQNRSNGSSVTNFCWDFMQTKSSPYSQQNYKTSRGGNSSSTTSGSSGNDPLLARRCANCDTTSTPLWRNGPRGPKSLCNACGIRFKKEERRAGTANANSSSATATAAAAELQHGYYYNNSWVQQTQQSQKMPCYSPANEFRFIDDDGDHQTPPDTAIPFLSWRLNVADRPGLVHDFTR